MKILEKIASEMVGELYEYEHANDDDRIAATIESLLGVCDREHIDIPQALLCSMIMSIVYQSLILSDVNVQYHKVVYNRYLALHIKPVHIVSALRAAEGRLLIPTAGYTSVAIFSRHVCLIKSLPQYKYARYIPNRYIIFFHVLPEDVWTYHNTQIYLQDIVTRYGEEYVSVENWRESLLREALTGTRKKPTT